MFKKYDPRIAAKNLVSKSVLLGTPRSEVKNNGVHVITSVGTARNHEDALALFAQWLANFKDKHLRNATIEDAAEYITLRALTCKQSAVDLARQAINFHLFYKDPIPFVPTTVHELLTNRAYSEAQIELITNGYRETLQSDERMLVSIEVAKEAGLRASELLSIGCTTDFPEGQRLWQSSRFLGLNHHTRFVVAGKGGLRREVCLTEITAAKLMKFRRSEMVRVRDRRADHDSYFDIVGGVNFSARFSRLAQQFTGLSYGAHGLRHTFAQTRLRALMLNGIQFSDALLIVSNELGHFSTTNTFAYLRH